MVGEIGGDEEEKAARYIGAEMSKPVVAYIAGFTAPPGKTMGHAGAIISGSSGTAQAKKEALEAVGVKVGTTPTEVAELAAETAERSRLARTVTRIRRPARRNAGCSVGPIAARGASSAPAAAEDEARPPRRSGSSSCGRRCARHAPSARQPRTRNG